jgi:hypothetical protein
VLQRLGGGLHFEWSGKAVEHCRMPQPDKAPEPHADPLPVRFAFEQLQVCQSQSTRRRGICERIS